MKKLWYVYGVIGLFIVFGLFNRYRTSQSLELVNKDIERISRPVEVAPVEQAPELPQLKPPPPPVANKNSAGSLLMMQKERDDFLRRHQLAVKVPDATGTLVRKSEGFESLIVSQRYGHYTFWVSAFDRAGAEEIRRDTIKTFGLLSDDLRTIKTNVSSPFQIVDSFEFDTGGKYCIALILRHPTTRKYIAVGFTAKKFNSLMEKISNKLFENLKPL